MENNIKKRRQYCHDDSSPALVFHELPYFNPPPDQASCTSFSVQPSQPPRPLQSVSQVSWVPSQEEFGVIQKAASILSVPPQRLLEFHPSFHQAAPQLYLDDSTSSPSSSKRPRLDESSSDIAMFGSRHSPNGPTGPQDLREKGSLNRPPEGSTMVMTERPFDFSGIVGALMKTTRTITENLCAPCTTFDSGYSGPMPQARAFSFEPRRAFQDPRNPAIQQPYDDTPATAANRNPPELVVPNPMDDNQLGYLTQYPTMQPIEAINMPPAHEAIPYAMNNSPLAICFSDRAAAVAAEARMPHEGTRGHVGESEMIHVTNNRSTLAPISIAPVQIAGPEEIFAGRIRLTPAGTVIQSDPGHPASDTRGEHGPPAIANPLTPPSGFPNGAVYPVHGHSVYAPNQWPSDYGNAMWPLGTRAASAKRGPFKNQVEREQTAQTRRIGSCIRCRMQRIRCKINPDDDKGPCLTCIRVANSKVWRLPCLRYKITDIQVFKPAKQVEGFEWTRRWMEGVVDDIANWADPDTKIIHVSEGYCSKKYVTLEVRRFIPQEGDKLQRSWIGFDGKRRSVEIPPYAICNTKKAKDEYIWYIDNALTECLNSILGPHNELLAMTYHTTLQKLQNPKTSEKEKKLLSTTLQLWMSIRLTTRSTIIVGDETLGMPRDIMDESSPLAGKIPLPPVMGAQIDLILINQIQKSWRKYVLEGLQEMIQNNKQKTWMTTYLVMHMMLHNASLITRHDASYARKHGIPRRFARESMVGKYHEGANVLLAYWHYCNKNIYPFSKQCKDSEFQQLATLDENMMQFVYKTREIIQKKASEWEQLRHGLNSEDDYYFVSQLYEENWKPREKLPIGADRPL